MDRIKRNIGKMIDQGAPETDIDAYLSSEGVTAEQLRGAPATSAREPEDVTAGMGLSGLVPGLRHYMPQAEAAIRAVAHPLTGVGEPGESVSERYSKNLPLRQADYAQAEQDQPGLSTALKVGGAFAGIAPLAATKIGAAALGAAPMTAATLGGKALQLGRNIAAGGASGAAMTAVDAAAGGEDPVEAAKTGALFGAGGSAVAPVVGKIAQGITGLFRKPGSMSDQLYTAVKNDHAAIRAMDPKVRPDAVHAGIKKIMDDQLIPASRSKETTAVLSEALDKYAPRPADAMSALTGVQPTAKAGVGFDELHVLRQSLGDVARAPEATKQEVEAARAAIRGLDNWYSTIPQSQWLKGNAQQVNALAKRAASNSAGGFRVDAMENLYIRAQDKRGPLANTFQDEIRAFIKPDLKGKSQASIEGFTDQEIELLRHATRGDNFTKILQKAGAFGGNIPAGILGATGFFQGDPRYYAAAGLGLGARGAGAALTRRKAGQLNQMVVARTPLAQQQVRPAPSPGINVAPYGMALYPSDRNQ